MAFKRNWDSSCPREWDRWEQDGTSYVIQDLPPEDDEEAVKVLFEEFLPATLTFEISDIYNDPESMQELYDLWVAALKQRMSLACFALKDGHRRLVALNVCVPRHKNDKELKITGKILKNWHNAKVYAEKKAKPLETLGLDVILNSFGLVVVKEYRGIKIGHKIIAAREPLCRLLGIKATISTFTSIISQKLAARASFKSMAEISLMELAQNGLDYPEDNKRLMKIMARRYD